MENPNTVTESTTNSTRIRFQDASYLKASGFHQIEGLKALGGHVM